MLGFPVPYNGELIYSTVARAGIHFGIESPKELLDEVFDDRKVVATVDLLCHLGAVAALYPEVLELGIENIAYKHTLLPIYAPFVTEGRRQQCLKWMGGVSQGAVHLALGVAASRVKQPVNLRYCPKCFETQLAEHGEYFWHRQWQVAGADCCLEHGLLNTTSVERHGYHRHEFSPASPSSCPSIGQNDSSCQSRVVTRQVDNLLNMPKRPSPSFNQWTGFYRSLVQKGGCNRGQQIDYDAIKQRVIRRWGQDWLRNHALIVNGEQCCWLRSIFRKHRKSFSYLEHIVVLDAFLPEGWNIEAVIGAVSALPVEGDVSLEPSLPWPASGKVAQEYREKWSNLVCNHGPKQARLNHGGAIYAWLYRHDRNWLLYTDRHYQQAKEPVNNRVDWEARDLALVRALCKVREEYDLELNSPRKSMNWYLSKIEHASTVEKKLDKLPLTRLFFSKFCESIEECQIRRITCSAIGLSSDRQSLKRWKILRLSGLSEERLQVLTRQFLETIVEA